AEVATGNGGPSLLERTEHMLKAFAVDAAAAVVCGTGEPQHLIVQRLPSGFHPDVAFFGEPPCVAYNVDPNLPNARSVTAYFQAFQSGLGVEQQLQATLLGAVLEYLNGPLQQLRQVERNGFEFQRPAFDAREVENVIDHLEQVFG